MCRPVLEKHPSFKFRVDLESDLKSLYSEWQLDRKP